MRIVLGISGGIAAYKTPDLVRRLRDVGADVRVGMTPNATRFVAPLSLGAVSEHGVIVDQWGDPERGGVDHIELARWSELLLIAPATANVIAKMAAGIADDALTTYAIAHRGPVAIAPAMNTFMLQHATVQQNLATLRARGVMVLDPDSGLLACGEEGAGRMPDPPEIAAFVKRHFFSAHDLAGKHILVTAGPTRGPIDPVRYISNRSSGKMGYALAEAAAQRGAIVTLVSGPASIAAPAGIATLERVTTANQMRDAVMRHLASQQIVIKAAAVADYAPVHMSDRKIKKETAGEEMTIALRRNPDILAEVAAATPRPFIVAFAAETDAVEENARQKLQRKRADLIIANDVPDPTIGFDSDQNAVVIIDRAGDATRIAKAGKLAVANAILDVVVAKLSS